MEDLNRLEMASFDGATMMFDQASMPPDPDDLIGKDSVKNIPGSTGDAQDPHINKHVQGFHTLVHWFSLALFPQSLRSIGENCI